MGDFTGTLLVQQKNNNYVQTAFNALLSTGKELQH